jgi:hypothetical protein
MKDLQREILTQVASGKITAEEGAARLESLDATETPPAAVEPSPPSTGATSADSPRRIRLGSIIGSAEVVGDPSVAYAVAEGPHAARQDGDTMVIEQNPLVEGSDHFTFGHAERYVVNGLDFQRRRLKVRMNPALALAASISAGSLRIEGVQGPIKVEILAGNCRISGFRGPLDLSIQAGNLTASGRLDGGASKVRCDMGSVAINLEQGSSVRLTARTTMGKVAIVGDGGEHVLLGQSGKEVRIGAGAATLDVECIMGNVRVSA